MEDRKCMDCTFSEAIVQLDNGLQVCNSYMDHIGGVEGMVVGKKEVAFVGPILYASKEESSTTGSSLKPRTMR